MDDIITPHDVRDFIEFQRIPQTDCLLNNIHKICNVKGDEGVKNEPVWSSNERLPLGESCCDLGRYSKVSYGEKKDEKRTKRGEERIRKKNKKEKGLTEIMI